MFHRTAPPRVSISRSAAHADQKLIERRDKERVALKELLVQEMRLKFPKVRTVMSGAAAAPA